MLNAKSPVVRAALGLVALGSVSATSQEASAAPAVTPMPSIESATDDGCISRVGNGRSYVVGSTLVVKAADEFFYAKMTSRQLAYSMSAEFCNVGRVTIAPNHLVQGAAYHINVDNGRTTTFATSEFKQAGVLVNSDNLSWRFGTSPIVKP